MTTVAATLDVNGQAFPVQIEPHQTLLSVLRDDLGLTGAKEGCNDSRCGACMVLVDGHPLNACSYLALQAAPYPITTVEGLTSGGELNSLQQTFLEHGAVQCGFCTPGMLMASSALLTRCPDPSEEDIRLGLAGNLCRCTGYAPIVEAVMRASEKARSDGSD